jgi:hypothetical protein
LALDEPDVGCEPVEVELADELDWTTATTTDSGRATSRAVGWMPRAPDPTMTI